ncbi:hypothetical protein E2C01_085716 [Portunus trituberculatus]|uniref:Uncharacterized protein n=1 Tax=Portunus trituberculatus TaxID=210409 RepID=A0A5B7J7H0_PORTR|nr:hypothetical protein [Portunus trituberculatus]
MYPEDHFIQFIQEAHPPPPPPIPFLLLQQPSTSVTCNTQGHGNTHRPSDPSPATPPLSLVAP